MNENVLGPGQSYQTGRLAPLTSKDGQHSMLSCFSLTDAADMIHVRV